MNQDELRRAYIDAQQRLVTHRQPDKPHSRPKPPKYLVASFAPSDEVLGARGFGVGELSQATRYLNQIAAQLPDETYHALYHLGAVR